MDLPIPWFQEKFDDHREATTYMVEKIYELHFKGHTFREVDLRHVRNFDTKMEEWHVFIRVFPIEVSNVPINMAFERETLPSSIGSAQEK